MDTSARLGSGHQSKEALRGPEDRSVRLLFQNICLPMCYNRWESVQQVGGLYYIQEDGVPVKRSLYVSRGVCTI